MKSSKKTAKNTIFSSLPADFDKVKAYTKKYSKVADVKGYHITKAMIGMVLFFTRSLSWRSAYRAGALLGKLMYLLKIRKKVAMTNLDIVYGDKKSYGEKDRIYYQSLVNFGRVIINFTRVPFQDESFWREKCELKSEDALKRIVNGKKGILFIAGHIGQMDLAAGKLGMSGYPISVVGKKIKNPVINRAIVEARNSMNVGTIKNSDSIRRILKGINRGESIVIVLDQNMKLHRGIFIDWMGRVASSIKAAAYLAQKTGASVLSGCLFQRGPDKFELVLTDEIPWVPFPDDPEKELKINAQKQSDIVQGIIYEHPELWFWIHRRWKIQPKGMTNPYE